MSGPSAKKVLVVGMVCGLAAAVLVRLAVVVLVGGVRVLGVFVILGAVWLTFRRPRFRRSS